MRHGWKIAALWASAGLAATLVLASGWTTTEALGTGWVASTNTQANSSWVPVAVLVRFAEPEAGMVTVWRESGGVNVELGRCVFTNAQSVVWIPDAPYSFGFGDVLRIGSTATNGVVQVIRKGG